MSNHRNRIVDVQSHRLSCCKFSEPSIYDEISGVPAWISLCQSSYISALLKPPPPLLLLYSRWKCSPLELHAEITRRSRAHPTTFLFFFFLVFFLRCDDESTRNIPVTAEEKSGRRSGEVSEETGGEEDAADAIPLLKLHLPHPSKGLGGGGGGDGVWRGGLCYCSSSGVTVLGRVGKQLLEEAELFRELAIETFFFFFLIKAHSEAANDQNNHHNKKKNMAFSCTEMMRRRRHGSISRFTDNLNDSEDQTGLCLTVNSSSVKPTCLSNVRRTSLCVQPPPPPSSTPAPPPPLSGGTINPGVIHKNWWHITFTAAPRSYSPFPSLTGRVLPFWQNTVLNVTHSVFSSVSQQALHTHSPHPTSRLAARQEANLMIQVQHFRNPLDLFQIREGDANKTGDETCVCHFHGGQIRFFTASWASCQQPEASYWWATVDAV